MAVGLILVRDRNVEGGPVLEEGEELKRAQTGVSIVLGSNEQEQGGGTLYITTRRLIWLSNDSSMAAAAAGGYAVTFRSLTMHAVSRDVEAFAKPCIYAQIESAEVEEEDEEEDEVADVEGDGTRGGVRGHGDSSVEAMTEGDDDGPGGGGGAVEMEVDGGNTAAAAAAAAAAMSVMAVSAPPPHPPLELSSIADMRLVPEDPHVLDALFQVLCECALLNPDQDDDDSDSDGEGHFFYNEEEVLANTASLRHQNGHTIQAAEELGEEEEDAERFEDAEHDDDRHQA